MRERSEKGKRGNSVCEREVEEEREKESIRKQRKMMKEMRKRRRL